MPRFNSSRGETASGKEFSERFKIWDIVDKNGYAEATLTSSRPVKEGNDYEKSTLVDTGIAKNGYVTSRFTFIRFVGHAYNKLKGLSEGTTITDLVLNIDREPYFNSNTQSVEYPKNYRFTVWEFEVDESAPVAANQGMDAAPRVAEPVQQQVYVQPAQQPAYGQIPVQQVAPATHYVDHNVNNQTFLVQPGVTTPVYQQPVAQPVAQPTQQMAPQPAPTAPVANQAQASAECPF